MMLTIHETVQSLGFFEYGGEPSKDLRHAMKEADIVIVFGFSDDLMEFRGAVHDEVGCYRGGKAWFTSSGLLTNECESENCPHFGYAKTHASIIEALWGAEPGYSWTYRTTIPHETFEITEDGEPYCRGIVFALKDVP